MIFYIMQQRCKNEIDLQVNAMPSRSMGRNAHKQRERKCENQFTKC